MLIRRNCYQVPHNKLRGGAAMAKRTLLRNSNSDRARRWPLGMGHRILSATVIACIGVLQLSSCALYHKAYNPPLIDDPAYELDTIEIDDFGSLWNVSAAQSVLKHVDALRRVRNV